jgi:hypothetical protein
MKVKQMKEEEENYIQKGMAHLRAEVRETCEDLEGSTEEEISKAVAFYLLEADVDLEGTFRAFDRLLDDKNLEKAGRLETEIAQTCDDLNGAALVLKGLLRKYRMITK